MFHVQASDTTIKGLVMNGCTTSVDIQSGSNNRVEGNFLGTDPTGTQRLVDSGGEVVVGNAPSARVGGSTPAARNLITACGVAVHANGTNNGAVIEGNVIGIAASGDVLLTPACGSTTFPIVVDGPNGQVIRNVIAGGANGIFLQGSSGKVARGNYVGTDVTGTVVLGLSQSAMDVSGTNHVSAEALRETGMSSRVPTSIRGSRSAARATSSRATSSAPTSRERSTSAITARASALSERT